MRGKLMLITIGAYSVENKFTFCKLLSDRFMQSLQFSYVGEIRKHKP